MLDSKIRQTTETFVKATLANDTTGHDWWHIYRVRRNAMAIAEQEGDVDLFVVELSALLHDIADSKKHDGDHSIGPKVAREFLSGFDLSDDQVNHICAIIEKQSYSAKAGKLPTKEGQIVQDADRLEALGAIGIARCFAYGGSKHRPLYHPERTDTSVQHFYDKLLTLKDLMNTETGKKLAQERHLFMQEFLEQFYEEWGHTNPRLLPPNTPPLEGGDA